MVPVRGVNHLQDIQEDVEAAHAAENRLPQGWSDEVAPAGRSVVRGDNRFRGSTGPVPGAGGRLLERCTEVSRNRYQTLLYFEELLLPEQDHGNLIILGCQILERELDHRLTAPGRVIAAALAAALEGNAQDHKKAEILRQWAGDRIPTTIGIQSLVLLALRRGWEQNTPEILTFLAARFQTRYQELLASKGLGVCLDRIRERFRNPACHGHQLFDPAAYEEFVRLMVAHRRFLAWDVEGPAPPVPTADCGIFYHHLSQLRLEEVEPPRADSPAAALAAHRSVQRLLALQTPADSSLRIDLQLQPPSATQGYRNIIARPVLGDRRLRLGDRVSFHLQTTHDCHVTLLDIGTSGTVAAIWPNAWRKETRAQAARAYVFPAPDGSEFDFVLAGRPGLERVIALATRRPLAARLLPDADAPFRVMTARAMDELADELGRMDPSAWAVARCEFEIRAG